MKISGKLTGYALELVHQSDAAAEIEWLEGLIDALDLTDEEIEDTEEALRMLESGQWRAPVEAYRPDEAGLEEETFSTRQAWVRREEAETRRLKQMRRRAR